MTMTVAEEAPWLEIAWRELGVTERAGAGSDPRVIGYYRDAGRGEIDDDSVPWCAAFVGACLTRTRHEATGSLLARSYATTGARLEAPRLGAIAVLTRGADPAAGHVGFVVGWSAHSLYLLGGNQGDAVTVDVFDRSRLIAFRWPSALPSDGDRPAPVPVVEQPTDDRFDAALAHVLQMEGGYTDDPYDPGGATNFGITIGTLASWRGIDLTAETEGVLKAELRRLDPETVRAIYRERYWEPSRAADLPVALGLMHFDASVNHGVSGAAKLLQTALGVVVDGEIGPVTLGAAADATPREVLARYADGRRARYRALPHFWRFGRGWLARVDRTLAAALAATASPSQPPRLSKEIPMTTQPTTMPIPQPKWWGHSLTIWGAIITAAATVVPALGPVIGVSLTPEVVRQIGGDVTQVAQATAGVIGTVLTIYGRLRASTRLEQRSLTLRL
jgi:uncharacterized protein (TIGR02594 family)